MKGLWTESSGIPSSIRWVIKVVTLTYVGVVVVVMGVWTAKAFLAEPNWLFAGSFTGVVGGTMVLGLAGKVVQKRYEVKKEIAEKDFKEL